MQPSVPATSTPHPRIGPLRNHGSAPCASAPRARRPRADVLTTRASGQDLLGVLTFSAVPFLAVQAFADSRFGKQVFDDLRSRKEELRRAAEKVEESRRNARDRSRWYGGSRPVWLGPLDFQYPEYLKGEVAGDYGFDILRLGEDPRKLEKYCELELLHCRWAMLASLGAFVPDVLNRSGVTNFPEAVWWRVGGAKLAGEDLNYLGVEGLRIAGAQGVAVIAFCQVLLMVGPEYARACGINALETVGWYLPGDANYPGSFIFDPLDLSGDPEFFEEAKVKEVKNGRLAMVAWLGLFAQALLTRNSPVQNLLDFLDDPMHNNAFAIVKQF